MFGIHWCTVELRLCCGVAVLLYILDRTQYSIGACMRLLELWAWSWYMCTNWLKQWKIGDATREVNFLCVTFRAFGLSCCILVRTVEE